MGKVVDLVRHPKRLAHLFHGRKDAGMAIAEYAVGIVVVIAFGALVFGVIQSDVVRSGVVNVIGWIFERIMGI